MKPNVFLMPWLGAEDRLTAYWHYVLSVVPGLGQAFVDDVCCRAAISSSKFLGAIDHPAGDCNNRPDLLVRCADYDLMFEHKLDSQLGPQQLHRYLNLATKKKWKMALLAADYHNVDQSVRQSSSFVCPRGIGAPPHFLWHDVHGIVANFTSHLAQEFKEYLEVLGLGKFDWAGLGNPFIDVAAAEQLRCLYDAITPIFRTTGASCRKRFNSLVFEVRRPFAPVHLINVCPIASVAEWDARLWGPVMALSVWVRREGAPNQRVLSRGSGYIRGSSPRVFVTNTVPVGQPPYDKRLHLEREYYVPLVEVLSGSKAASQKRLVDFVQASVDHLQGCRGLCG